VLLDARTWTSGKDTAAFVEHIHEAMRNGVHLNCIHEFPSVVGPPRYECEFGLMFGDDWTPAHLTSGKTNLYKEIAFALKGVEWRQPGLVAVASKLAGSAKEHAPIDVQVPSSYVPKKGPNRWKNESLAKKVEAILGLFDANSDYVASPDELHSLVLQTEPNTTPQESNEMFNRLLASESDSNGDGKITVEELAIYLVKEKPDMAEMVLQANASKQLALQSSDSAAAPAPAPETVHMMLTKEAQGGNLNA